MWPKFPRVFLLLFCEPRLVFILPHFDPPIDHELHISQLTTATPPCRLHLEQKLPRRPRPKFTLATLLSFFSDPISPSPGINQIVVLSNQCPFVSRRIAVILELNRLFGVFIALIYYLFLYISYSGRVRARQRAVGLL